MSEKLKPTHTAIYEVLAGLLRELEHDSEQDPALQAILLNQAITSSIIWRDQLQRAGMISARGHTTYDFPREALLRSAQQAAKQPEGNVNGVESRQGVKGIYFAGTNVQEAPLSDAPKVRPKKVAITTTSHPNINLPVDMEQKLLQFAEKLNGLTIAQKQQFLEFSQDLDGTSAPDFIADLKKSLETAVTAFRVPEKQTMEVSLQRGLVFNTAMARTVPGYFNSIIRANRTYGADGTKKTRVSEAELRDIGAPVQFLTWYDVDGDGNPFVTPEVVAGSIAAYRAAQRELVRKELDMIHPNLARYSDLQKEVRKLQERLEKEENILQGEAFLNELYKLKVNIEAIEAENGVALTPRAIIYGEEAEISTLDAVIAMVQNNGEVVTKKEQRQNAETIRSAITVLAKKLRDADLISEKEANDHRRIFAILTKDEGRSKQLRAFVKQDLDTKPETVGDEEKDYYKMLELMRLAVENPGAINSMVIAETGALKQSDLPGKSKAFQTNELAAEKGLKDMISAHVLLEIMGEHGQKQPIELRGLFEGRLPVENIPNMLVRLFEDAPDIKNRYSELMTKTIMFAQSDTSREHGIMSILSVFESNEQIRLVGGDLAKEMEALAKDMARAAYPDAKEGELEAKKDYFIILIKLGAGAALSRGWPPSLLHSDDTTAQGGALVYIAQYAHLIAEYMSATKSVYDMGYRLNAEEAQRITRTSYTGGNLPMDEANISPKVRDYIEELGLKGCRAHEQFMDDPRADAWFDRSPYAGVVSTNNKGPRPNQKKKGDAVPEFPPHNERHTARAIGSGLAQYMEGSNPIFVLGLSDFFKLDANGKLSEENRDKVIQILQESSKHNELISRAELGILLADYQNAWKAHGYERARKKDGTIVIRQIGENGNAVNEIPLHELAAIYKKPYEERNGDPKNYMEHREFPADAIALAYMDQSNEHAARALYEIRHEMRARYALRNGQIEDGGQTIPIIPANQFTPAHLSAMLHPAMKSQYDLMKPILDTARDELATKHAEWLKNGSEYWTKEPTRAKEYADSTYYAYAAVEQIVEGANVMSAYLMQQQMLHDTWRTERSGLGVKRVEASSVAKTRI